MSKTFDDLCERISHKRSENNPNAKCPDRKTSELRKLYNRGTAPREAGMFVHPPL
jgi:hypothetical protein